MNDWFDKETNRYFDLMLSYGTNILEAVAILVIGFWLGNKLARYVYRFMVKRNVDPSLRNFLKDLFHLIINVLVILLAASNVGMKIDSLLAVLGGAALGIGFGLQGGLSNFAGGVMIILNKPFKVGDLIKFQNQMGYVERIEILNTTLRTPLQEVIIVPNAPIFNSPLVNFSSKRILRYDVTIGIEYKADFKKLRILLKSAIRKDDIFLKEKPITIEIEQFADSSVVLTVRAYASVGDYWDAPLRLNSIIKSTMDENGFTIPFPQRDVHLIPANPKIETDVQEL